MTSVDAEALQARRAALPGAPALARGETPSSWLDRVMALYGLRRDEFWGETNMALSKARVARLRRADLDQDIDLWASHVCASAVNVTITKLRRATASLPKWILAPRARNAYCPDCFDEELRAGCIPHFKREWTAAWSTHCTQHGCPLSSWNELRGDGQRVLPVPRPWLGRRAQSVMYMKGLRRDLELTRRLMDRSGRTANEDQLLWRHQIAFERRIKRVVLARSNPHDPLSVGLVKHVVTIILQSYGKPGRDSYRRSLGPATSCSWLYGPSLLRSPLGRVPQFEELAPSARRSVLWLTSLLVEGGAFFVRTQRTLYPSFCCSSCAWATVVSNVPAEQRLSLKRQSLAWPDQLRCTIDRALAVANGRR